jgi:hypothetical protein
MSRFSKNIPAVRQFKTEAAPAAFDGDKASRLLRDGLSLVNSLYPAGAMEWLAANRADVCTQLKSVWKSIGAAIRAEDIKMVTEAVELWIKYMRRAIELFNGRPPVIEIQGDLLAA